MMWYFLVLFLAVTANFATFATNSNRNDDTSKFIEPPKLRPHISSAQRIKADGYPSETHLVETSDNYVLNVFRIPYSPRLNNEKEQQKPVVFIMHGLFSCSDCYILNGPDDAIAYNFADAGFDVWLGNSRGNIYGQTNTRISKKHPYFWRYSWHEIGVIDMPETIDYILKLTGEKKLHVVAHSQGGTVFHVMASMRPEYNEKIKTAHMLAPAVFMGNASSYVIDALKPLIGKPGLPSDIFGDQQVIPKNAFVQRLIDVACGGKPRYPKYCKTLFLLWAGRDSNLNETLLPYVAETHPAGASTTQVNHFIQLRESNHFRQYDHGAKKNMQKYKQLEPPDYALEQITADMYYYYGLNDASANKQDMSRLKDLIPNVKVFYEVPLKTWAHLDFIFGQQVKELINDQVVAHTVAYEDNEKLKLKNKNKNL